MIFNAKNWYWKIGSDASQFWSSAANGFVASSDAGYVAWVALGNVATSVPTVTDAMAAVIRNTGLLDASDLTMSRVSEAIALGLNTWTGSDVVAWVNYRRALRAIAGGSDTSSTAIPAKPAYPAGT